MRKVKIEDAVMFVVMINLVSFLIYLQSHPLIKEKPLTDSYENSEPFKEYPLEKKNLAYSTRWKSKVLSSPTLSRGTALENYKLVTVLITGYCPCRLCSDGHGYNTASGVKANHNIVAAPKDIPFGSLIYVPGFENGFTGTVGDRGGSINWIGDTLHIDVFYTTHSEAKNIKITTKGYIRYER